MTSHAVRAVLLGPTLLVVALAGCIGDGPGDALDGVDLDLPGKVPALKMDFTNCVEGGGVSTYGGPTTFADTYTSADVTEETNSPFTKPVGMPGEEQWGNWHMGFKCETATVDGVTEKDYLFGYVGQMVLPPAWDPGGADQHFIVTGFGMQNGTWRDTARDMTKVDYSQAYGSIVDYYVPKDAPRAAAYVEYADLQKGVYMQYSTLEHYREFEPRTMRFWWGVPIDGSQSTAAHGHNPGDLEGTKWHPAYFDVTSPGGHQYTTPNYDRAQMFCHLGNDDHGTGPVGGICEPTHTLVYYHDAMTFSTGQTISSVVMDKIHVH